MVSEENDLMLSHYEALGNSYKENTRSHEEKTDVLMEILVSFFDCKPHHQVVEIGAGTCACSLLLLSMLKLEKPIICVDNSKSMLEHGKDQSSIETVLSDGLEYSKLPVTYDRLFCRAFLHHLGETGAAKFIENIYKQLNEGGIFVNIAMNNGNNRPWFKKLKEAFPKTNLSYLFIIEELKKAGFSKVNYYPKKIKVIVDKNALFYSFRRRYVSIMQFVSDDEIEEGIKEIDEAYPNQDLIEFLDDQDFIVATK